MNEQELERRLAELRETWRVPGEPPLDRMWSSIEAQAFDTPRERPRRTWTRTLLPIAATLVLGFGIGQVTPRLGGRSPAIPAETATGPSAESTPVRLASADAPFVGVATDYVERVTGLLVALADEARRGGTPSPAYSTAQARDLLATTRLLMDSPEVTNPHLQTLFQDLELVLAQIVRLPARPAPPDVYLIDQAVDQRDVIPRLRILLAENTSSQP